MSTLPRERSPTLRGFGRHLPVETQWRHDVHDVAFPRRVERVRALIRATSRELLWGLRAVSREAERWHARANEIPDPRIRADALAALHRKRGNINGAALFWTLPDRRVPVLLEALVAYEMLADFLDCLNESEAHLGIRHGTQLQLALQEAFEFDVESSDYYLYRPGSDDGGYLQELVATCRRACRELPSFGRVRPYLRRATALSAVLSLNHEYDPVERAVLLRAWTQENFPAATPHRQSGASSGGLTWFERGAGASAWLTVLAMLALAAEPAETTPASVDIEAVYRAYLSSIAPAGAMLDSYGDILDDHETGDHSYISHYPSMDDAVARVSHLLGSARREAGKLPNGSRHAVLTACMIAFYLSKDSVRTPAMRANTRALGAGGGALERTLVPVLRTWRTVYGQRSA